MFLFGELPGMGGGVPGPAPSFAYGPVGGPYVVVALANGLAGLLLLAFGVLKLPGQVGDASRGLLLLFLGAALLLLSRSQLALTVVQLLFGIGGLPTGLLQTHSLLAAPRARGTLIGRLVGRFGATGSWCRGGLPGDGGEAGRGGQRLGQTASRPLVGGLEIGQYCVQGVLDLLPHVVAEALSGTCRQLAGLLGQSEGDLMLLRRQLPQLIAVQIPMGSAQPLAQPQQPLHFIRLFAHQQIAGPRCQGGARQPTDLFGQFPLPRSPRRLGPHVSNGRELARSKGVQLIGDSIQIHPCLLPSTP